MTSTTAGAVARSEDRAGDKELLRAGTVFALAVVLHNGDHLRRGADAVTNDVFGSAHRRSL